MSLSEETLANLSRSEASLQAAKLLLDSDLTDDAASRAYYAVFSSATALLLQEKEVKFKSHTGLLRALSLHFVKTGRLAKKFNEDINKLAEIRNLGDYGDVERVTTEEAKWAVEAADSFVQQVKKILLSDE